MLEATALAPEIAALVVLLLARGALALGAGLLEEEAASFDKVADLVDEAGLPNEIPLLVAAGLGEDIVTARLDAGFELEVVLAEYVYPCCLVRPAVLVHSDIGTLDPLM